MSQCHGTSTGRSGVDLREHVRIDTVLPLSCWSDREHIPDSLRSTALNLCGGGLRVATASPVHVGDALSVRIGLPDGIVAARAQVVRVKAQADQTAQVSMKFTGIGSCDQERLVQYVYAK
ncbi:MAG: PilZ domain-containing protein [Nitrospirae bacterium]|nr:MAG: PilZ domain-containing protein [Nitrospirota bacterium]